MFLMLTEASELSFSSTTGDSLVISSDINITPESKTPESNEDPTFPEFLKVFISF